MVGPPMQGHSYIKRSLATAFVFFLGGCSTIFPRYHTATRTPPAGTLEQGTLSAPPDNLRRLEFISAELPPSRPDGSTWDADGDPDLFAILFRNGDEVYRTPVVRNSLNPQWNGASITVHLESRSRTRIELRDDDGPVSTLVALIEFTGAPRGAMEGSNTVLRLEGGSVVQIRSSEPVPLLGMGIEYEVHETFLKILSMDSASPARRPWNLWAKLVHARPWTAVPFATPGLPSNVRTGRHSW
jgi:C2 domain